MIVVLDTETGGLNPDTTSILSFGACLLEDPTVRTEVFIAESPYCVEAGARKVNGIDLVKHDAMAFPPVSAWNKIKMFLRQGGVTGVAGHNVAFDLGYMRRLHRLAGDETPFDKIVGRRPLDTMIIAAFLKQTGRLPEEQKLGLTDLLAFYGIERDGAHTALGDAVATAALLNTMIAQEGDHR